MKDWKKEIDGIIRDSLKNRDMTRANVMRMLKSDLFNEELKSKEALTEEQALQVIQRAVKKRKESVEEFRKAGQEERAGEEEGELKYLEVFLPEALSGAELAQIVEESARETGASGMKDFGKLMGAVMKKAQGRADGKIVNEAVKKKLSA